MLKLNFDKSFTPILGNMSPEKADTIGVINFSAALNIRLSEIRTNKDEKPWHHAITSNKNLRKRLKEAITEGDMIETGLISMMLYNKKKTKG